MNFAKGSGTIEVERVGLRSVACRARARSPLQLLTPKNHGTAAWVYLSSHGGGIVGGDRIDLGVRVGAGAEAVLLTQSSTKVYRPSREVQSSGAVSGQHTRVRVEAGATYVSIPDPVVCFARSSLEQEQTVELEAGASALVADLVCSGRVESGERWGFDRYRSRVEVARCGRAVFRETLLLENERGGALDRRFGRYNVMGLVLFFGPAFEDHGRRIIARKLATGPGVLISAAALPREGCIVRIAADSTETAGRELKRFLDFLPERLGDDPWARKW